MMPKKQRLLITISFIGVIFALLFLYLQKNSEYENQGEKIHSACEDIIIEIVDSFTEYKNNHQKEQLHSAELNLYALSRLYELLPEDYYDTDLHLRIQQTWQKLNFEEELPEYEVDILIEAFTLLSHDLNDTAAYYKLLGLFND